MGIFSVNEFCLEELVENIKRTKKKKYIVRILIWKNYRCISFKKAGLI